MVSQFLHVHFHLNMTSRLSLNGGETWPTAFILLSSELATPVSALVFARWIIIIEKDNDDDDDDHCCYVSSIVKISSTGEEFPRRLDLRRLHRDHDQGRRLYAAT